MKKRGGRRRIRHGSCSCAGACPPRLADRGRPFARSGAGARSRVRRPRGPGCLRCGRPRPGGPAGGADRRARRPTSDSRDLGLDGRRPTDPRGQPDWYGTRPEGIRPVLGHGSVAVASPRCRNIACPNHQSSSESWAICCPSGSSTTLSRPGPTRTYHRLQAACSAWSGTVARIREPGRPHHAGIARGSMTLRGTTSMSRGTPAWRISSPPAHSADGTARGGRRSGRPYLRPRIVHDWERNLGRRWDGRDHPKLLDRRSSARW